MRRARISCMDKREDATQKGNSMQLGMPTLIENATLEDNVALCSSLGLNFVELNMNFPEYRIDRLEQTDEMIQLAKQAGIYYTVHLDENLNIADFNPLVSGAYLETVRRSVFAAKKLLPLRDRFGDKSQPLTVNMHMNHGVHITLPDRKVQLYERDFDFYMDSFSMFRTLCEKWIDDSDIVIVIENTDGFRNYEKTAIEYLLKSPKFALTWDIGHSKAIGEKDVPFLMEHREKMKDKVWQWYNPEDGKLYTVLAFDNWTLEQPEGFIAAMFSHEEKKEEDMKHGLIIMDEQGKVREMIHGEFSWNIWWNCKNDKFSLSDKSSIRLATVTPERRQELIEALNGRRQQIIDDFKKRIDINKFDSPMKINPDAIKFKKPTPPGVIFQRRVGK